MIILAKGDIDFLTANNNDCTIEDENGIQQRGILSLDPQITSTLADSKTALVSTSFADNEIVKGNAYQVHRRFIVPTGGLKLVLDLSNVSVDKALFTLPIRMATSEGQVFVNTYIIDNYTGGTLIQAINRNGESLNVAEGEFKTGVTSTDVAGDDLRQYIVGVLSTNQFSGGGSGGGNAPKIFGKKIIMIDVENQETTSVEFEINFNWYEV